jgi:spore coat protein CotF
MSACSRLNSLHKSTRMQNKFCSMQSMRATMNQTGLSPHPARRAVLRVRTAQVERMTTQVFGYMISGDRCRRR